MNKTKLKNYAPQARKDFIAAVSARANQLGLSSNGSGLVVSPATRQGDVTLIEGRDWPAKVYGQRERLVKRMQREGFDQTVEAVAYTWFNRFAALRYMELHDYLEHGYRVLSSIGNEGGAAGTPDILLHAVDLAQSQNLPGLNADEVGRLKLAGNQDGELYRKLLIAQCNALSNAMPFLFERIDDETELLLPDNLLRTDSVIAKLVSEIPEEDWQEVEVIGWLYQFYISEKKDQVIGKVVKSEDIPAATQLFTPNWIVKYMVQNSVGRLWMMANPESSLKTQWEYYIEPAEQTPEVNAQLDALIKTRMDEDGGSLNPETITVLDPACGSGHILVEAYELLKGIYLERGYRLRDIPRLILEKNLYGLDIDDRAAQMAAFALLMKGRADDRRLLNESPNLNVLSLQESKGLDLEELSTHLAPYGIQQSTIKYVIDEFEFAKTLGSLINIHESIEEDLVRLKNSLSCAIESGDLYAKNAADDFMLLVKQVDFLSSKFDIVSTNPPYIGSKGLNPLLKSFCFDNYPLSKSDLYAVCVERFLKFSRSFGFSSFMTPFTWMFLSTFEGFREVVHGKNTLQSLIQPQYHTFFESAAVPICVFALQNSPSSNYVAKFIKLTEFRGAELQPVKTLEALRDESCPWLYKSIPDSFRSIPSKPIAYWVPEKTINSFASNNKIGDVAQAKQGLITGDNGRFLRNWHEVDVGHIGFGSCSREASLESRKIWFPFQKGGSFRKWYGNHDLVVNWHDDGAEIKSFVDENGKLRSRPQGLDYFFKPGVTWTSVTISTFNCRFSPAGFVYSEPGPVLYTENKNELLYLGAFLNSKVGDYLLQLIAPAMHFNQGHISSLPRPEVSEGGFKDVISISESLIQAHKADWDDYERSWDFRNNPLVGLRLNSGFVADSYAAYLKNCEMVYLNVFDSETKINELFISALALGSELDSSIAKRKISLTSNPEYRYDVDTYDEEISTRFKADTVGALISYIVGCLMGRYSIDEPGLIYAHSGNVGFNETRYKTFPADADGIVPITDELWFEDDAANRVREFVRVVWGADTLEENMAWLAESLGKKDSETPDEAVRRYLSDKFFKDHLQTYKKRPIYWLFSSGKQGAFQALVYLHRYHEGTLARMRAEYVVPLTGKIQSRIEMLERDAESASSTAARNKINKEIEKLRKKHVELLAYDEKLRHYADMRIKLDLDDGVKVNYGKFGDLLDSVKAITGGSDD